MDRNKGLEFRKESSLYSNTGRSAKEENVQRNRGGQEDIPKKECQGEVREKPFLKCCGDQREWGMKIGHF